MSLVQTVVDGDGVDAVVGVELGVALVEEAGSRRLVLDPLLFDETDVGVRRSVAKTLSRVLCALVARLHEGLQVHRLRSDLRIELRLRQLTVRRRVIFVVARNSGLDDRLFLGYKCWDALNAR